MFEVDVAGARITFFLGADDNPETVENIDVEVRLDDGSRWSGTFLSLPEVARIMDRWQVTGEYLGGVFFQCRDLVIVRNPGVPAMTQLVARMVESGELRDTLMRLPDMNE